MYNTRCYLSIYNANPYFISFFFSSLIEALYLVGSILNNLPSSDC